MKKTKWFSAAFMIAAFAVTASACTGGGAGTGGNGQGGGSVPKDDVYEDYDPEKQPGGGAFDFDGNYAPPELKIDGKGDDPQWQAIEEPLTTFGKKIDGKDAVSVKVYRGKDALFFLFDVTDPVLLTKGNTNDDAVTRGDSIELYLDTLGDGGRSPQSDDYQINLGIHGKTRIMQGAGGFWGSWNGLIDYEVDLKGGTLNDGTEANDTGYSVEVMVPYKQIMIEKDDTIAIAFGQVDKFGAGDISKTDWDWYGWSWGGTFREPQTPDNYALLDKDNNLIDRDDQEKAPADIAGFVKDTEGVPVEGATASVEVGGEIKTATTAADGYFVIEDVDPEGTYTVTVSKTGYLDGVQTYTRAELRAANGGRVLKDFTVTATADLQTTTVTGTVKNIVNGIVGGALVTVKGTAFHATADQNGAFSIEGVPAGVGDVTLVVTHTGYGDSETLVQESDLVADGTIGGSHYAGGAFTSAGLDYKIASNTSEGGYHATLLIPYGYLEMAPLEVFGLSLGQWSTMANGGNGDWDGWAPSPHGFVAPENTPNYLRIGSRNTLYKASNNTMMATFSGNVKIAGVTVSANGVNATSGADGAWSMSVPVDANAVEVTYSKTGYVTKKTTVAAGYFDNADAWTENVTLQEHKVTISGKVTDQDGNAVAGAEITIEGEGASFTATTDASGNYSVDNVTTFVDLTVTFEKENYASGTTTFTTAQLAAGDAFTADKQITSLSAVKKITVTGKVAGIEGNLQGVTVRVDGTELSATTGADGTFSLAEFDAVDCTLTLSKTGYENAKLTFTAQDLQSGATSFAFEDAFLMREYTQLGNAFGAKSDKFASFVPYVTRGENAFEFKFVGSHAFEGTIEMFVDTKLSGGARNATDYRFNLQDTGAVAIENWGGSNTNPAALTLRIAGTEEQPEVYFTIPYAFLNVSRDEIIGVTFGQSCTDGWDGWNHDLKGLNGITFVAPEIPWDYIRIGKDNQAFWNAENKTVAELDLSSYNLHFGKSNDSFHAKVSRDEEGVTFDFVSLGDFNKNGGNLEAILLYIDKGEPAGGWGVDYQYKIVSDGNVYGNDGSDASSAGRGAAWWSANENTKLGSVTISRENGVTRLTYKVLYTTIGVAADEVFGFTAIEGWLTGDNNSDEYLNGMTYTHESGCHVVGDAANTAGYVRIKADGTLAVADSNAAVTE